MKQVVEGYPVAVVFAKDDTPERVAVFLLDLPGCGAQGKHLREAMAKLEQITPPYLAELKARGVELPSPSQKPAIAVGNASWADIPFTVPTPVTEKLEHLKGGVLLSRQESMEATPAAS